METKQDSTAGCSDEIVLEVVDFLVDIVVVGEIVVVEDNEDSAEPKNFKKDIKIFTEISNKKVEVNTQRARKF